jgi:hypothetical protein
MFCFAFLDCTNRSKNTFAFVKLTRMSDDILEVKSAVLHTFEGETRQVQGGVYLTPEGYLSQSNELATLRRQKREDDSLRWPMVAIGAALLGLAAGYWLAQDSEDDLSA